MRASRFLLTSVTAAVTAAVSFASPTSAEPRSEPQQVAAPYSGSYVFDSLDCWRDTTCTALGDASADSGQVTASMDMQRATPDEPRHESGSSAAGQVVALRAPRGATSLTATFTWQVRSATASVTPQAGSLFAGSNLSAGGSCSGCTVTGDSTSLVSTAASVRGYTDSRSIENVQKVLTVTIDGLPRNGMVRLTTGGNAYTDMNPSRVCVGFPGCDALPPLEEGHAGTAHADLDATLTSVDLSYR